MNTSTKKASYLLNARMDIMEKLLGTIFNKEGMPAVL